MKELVLYLALIYFTEVTCNLTCLKCGETTGVESLDLCTEFTTCAADEVCYVEFFFDDNAIGKPQYRAGCRNVHLCKLMSCNEQLYVTVAPHSRRDIPICLECCYNDTCNIKGCGSSLIDPSSTGSRCFSCERDAADKSTCRQTVQCQSTEQCYYGYETRPLPHYVYGCKSKAFCTILEGIQANQNATDSGCCRGDLCNVNFIAAEHNLESVADNLPCPTGLVKTPAPTPAPTSTTTLPSSTTPTPAPTSTPAPTTPTPAPTTPTPASTTPTPAPTTSTPAPTTSTPAPTTPTPAPTTPTPALTTSTAAPTTPTPAPTTPTPAPTTSTAAPTTPTPALTTSTTLASTTTKQLPHTIAPIPITCEVCSGPARICEKLHHSTQCLPPNNYCINHVINDSGGNRLVNRTCGNFDTCFREWFEGSSDNDKCQNFDEASVLTLDFECTFCCVKDGCNKPLRPDADSLYIDV